MSASTTQGVVLVVEDEPLILFDAAQIVEDAGFTALTARNADEAIAILEARKDIRIVFTDIDMPGSMDGLKLAAAVRDRWPPVALLVTSGKVGAEKAMLPEGGVFMPKPYSAKAVDRALRAFVG